MVASNTLELTKKVRSTTKVLDVKEGVVLEPVRNLLGEPSFLS